MSANNDTTSSIAPFLFEAAILKRVERTGYAFLGSGSESVAAHVYGMSVMALVLASMCPEADMERILLMCLVHDMPESRTGDANAVHKLYVSRDEQRAMDDICKDLPFESLIKSAWQEFSEQRTLEARLAHDADQLDMLLSLKEQMDTGNPEAGTWIPHVIKRLLTEDAKRLANEIMHESWSAWWMRCMGINR